jgi:hypothetical protein
VKSERLQRLGQSGAIKIVRDNAGAGGEAGFDVGLYFQAFFDGLFGDESGSNHYGWVAGVRAAGDRGDDDGAVSNWSCLAVFHHTLATQFVFLQGESSLVQRRGERFTERGLHVRKPDSILRAFGAGQ